MKTEIDEQLKKIAGDGNEATADISFPQTFTGFRGHFPDRPILPGVCQIGIALAMAERMSGKPQTLVEVIKAKFVSVVTPDQLLTVQCQLEDDLLRTTLSSGEKRIGELKLRISDA